MAKDVDDFDEIKTVRKTIHNLALVKDLLKHPGWTVIQDHFDAVITKVGELLDFEEDFKKITRLQERKKAFKAMLETVNALCEQHSEQLLRLENMEQDKLEQAQDGFQP